jgi:hypothetical protein
MRLLIQRVKKYGMKLIYILGECPRVIADIIYNTFYFHHMFQH